MKKILEDYLWNEILYADSPNWFSIHHRFPRDVIKEMIERGWINSPKQAWATLEKWTRKGIYDYGCCLDLGWKIRPKTSAPSSASSALSPSSP